MSLLFSSYVLSSPKGPLTLSNRVVVAPMCQYSAINGEAQDWHLMHWGNLLNSGAGLFIIEATGVTPEGRITPACLGLWDDRTESALKDKLTRARSLAPATPVFIQLAHAGRKASSATPWAGGQLLPKERGGWDMVAPSAIPQLDAERLPHELSKAELKELISSMTDNDIWKLNRGGHDPHKVYAAYYAATQNQGSPTVIIAKTVKGYGMGKSGESINTTHQQKKLYEQDLLY